MDEQIKYFAGRGSAGKMNRREFMGRAAALGLSTALASTMYADAVYAAGPMKGGDLKLDGLAEEFDPLALDAFAYQYQHIEPYRRLCDRQGATPKTIDHWNRAPAVPTLAFKSLELTAAEPRETFRSSGTTGSG